MEKTKDPKGSVSSLGIKKWLLFLALFGIGILVGALFLGGEGDKVETPIAEVAATEFTCSMHPQIRQSDGDCPICGMELIPVDQRASSENDLEIKMSEAAVKIAEIRLAKVKKQRASRKIHLAGKIKVDERKINMQTSHFSGRVDKLLINYTGEHINKGAIIGYIYSPDLVTAQKELLEAEKIKVAYPEIFKAAKRKLKNWKISDSQIEDILNQKEPIESFPMLSDHEGIVLSEIVKQGDYISKGDELFEITNLSELWILFDAYENDIPWIKESDTIEYEVHSLPGEKFSAAVSFIDPIINVKTRVAEVRVSVDNRDGRLKPEMFASGKISSNLAGNEKHIIVPKSAVLWTGKRSVVYVKTKSDNGLSFMMRQVVLGSDLGDTYIVKEGLDEGEEVAANGAFSIDASAQLAGKTSMMNPPPSNKGIASTLDILNGVETSIKSSAYITNVLSTYIAVCVALSADDFATAREKSRILYQSVQTDDFSQLVDENQEVANAFKEAVASFVSKKNLDGARKELPLLTEKMASLIKGKAFNQTVYVQYCPMANDNAGAHWLSFEPDISNPYFGASMLHCGETQLSINSNL
jgi:Cu(I)/Ag(I) efflux system membrane fusion protein